VEALLNYVTNALPGILSLCRDLENIVKGLLFGRLSLVHLGPFKIDLSLDTQDLRTRWKCIDSNTVPWQRELRHGF
jgi:hypothetical protein